MISLSDKMLASVNLLDTASGEDFTVILKYVDVHQEVESGYGPGVGPVKMTITGIVSGILKEGEESEHVSRLQANRH